MAGPYYPQFKVANGRTIILYAAANAAVGVCMPVSIKGMPTTTSPTDFTVPAGETWVLTDFMNEGCTSGVFEITSDGESKGRIISNSSHANDKIRPPLNITLVSGRRYRCEVIATFPA